MRQFEGDLTPERIHHLPLEELQDLIRPVGFYNQKSQYLKALTERFLTYTCHEWIVFVLSSKGLLPRS
ncbi:MAG: hypothetical protein GX239_00745 [Clostridiaceae bacterium]|nr:hypothetical protein [Clostridiaceae bacterium]